MNIKDNKEKTFVPKDVIVSNKDKKKFKQLGKKLMKLLRECEINKIFEENLK